MGNPFKSVNSIDVYEVNRNECGIGEKPKMHIANHWNISGFVVIEVDGKEYTVLADELIRAIANAKNAHKY